MELLLLTVLRIRYTATMKPSMSGTSFSTATCKGGRLQSTNALCKE